MSLLFGYYSRKNIIAPDVINDAVADFSFQNSREIQIYQKSKFFLAADKQWAKSNTIAENEDKTIVLCLSGDISNYNQLAHELISKGHIITNRENPAEVLFHAWSAYKEQTPEKLQGNFAIALYDYNEDKLFLINDRFGIYPLFVYRSSEAIIFCNEIEPVLKCKNNLFTPDKDAILHYITLGAPLPGKTFVNEITNLAPASILRINPDEISTQKYFTTEKISVNSDTAQHNATEIFLCVQKCITEKTEQFNNVGCMLTGGLDTRFVLGCIPAEKRKEIKFSTFITPGLDPLQDKDVLVSQLLAKKFNLDHSLIEQKSWSDQWKYNFDISMLNLWRERTNTRMLGGIYGGEFLNGGCLQIIPPFIHTISSGFFSRLLSKNKTKNLIDKDALHESFQADAFEIRQAVTDYYNKLTSENKILEFTMHYLTRSFFSQIYGGINAKWQSPWMFPLKSYSPFTDNTFLTLLLSIPQSQLTDEKQPLYEHIYSVYLNEFTDIPVNSAFGTINGSCMNFFEQGTEPRNGRNLKNHTILNKYITEDQTWDRKIFCKEYIQKNMTNKKLMSQFFDLETWFRHVNL